MTFKENGTVRTPLGWKISKVKGGMINVTYEGGGCSTPIVGIRKGEVLTESGTVYKLLPENMLASMWQMNIQFNRPEQYVKLQEAGIIA